MSITKVQNRQIICSPEKLHISDSFFKNDSKVKEIKARRVDTNLKSKKVPTKSDLVLQVKALEEAYSDLEEVNEKNTKVIETLKE